MRAIDSFRSAGRGVAMRMAIASVMVMMFFASFSREALAQVGFGAVGGVSIDPEGMLQDATGREGSKEALAQLRESARMPPDESKISAESRLRKISLRRLEAAAIAAHAGEESLPAEIRYLAGLRQVRYVLFYPEQEDVVLAGPAGAWEVADSFDVVSRRSRRPVLHFDDLCTALRFAFANPPPDGFLGCSIDPTEEGLASFKQALAGIRNPDSSQMEQVGRTLAKALGPQKVTLFGTLPQTRAALEMLSADYHLKRLAMGHDPSPVRGVPSYIDLIAKNATSGTQPQHRFWLNGHYDAVRHSPDRLAFELEGAGLRVSTAATRAANQEKPSRAATQFTESMTRALPKLAESIPAFATLQNLVSLAVAAELIRQQSDRDATAGDAAPEVADETIKEGGVARIWRPWFLLDAEKCPLESFTVPRQTPSLAGVRATRNRQWVFSVSGGIEIDVQQLTGETVLQPAKDGGLDKARSASVPQVTEDRWWWD